MDVQNRVNSLTEWVGTSEGTRTKGQVFFSQSQLCVLLVLPYESELNSFNKIKVMAAPSCLKEYVYQSDHDMDWLTKTEGGKRWRL